MCWVWYVLKVDLIMGIRFLRNFNLKFGGDLVRVVGRYEVSF